MKRKFLHEILLEQLDTYIEEFQIYSYQKGEYIIDLNIKAKITKLTDENIRENLCKLWVDFWVR